MSQQKSHFECVVTETYCYRDMDNRHASECQTHVVSADSISDLYEKLGGFKIIETLPDQCESYTEIDFGHIREIVVVSETDVDEGILKTTVAYQQWERQRMEAAIKKQQALDAQAAAKEAREIAELKRLQEKYPTTLLQEK